MLSGWALGIPGVTRLEALVEPDNEGSIRVLNGAAFHPDGLLRGYLPVESGRADVVLYSLIREDLENR
jgi:[ribosomal protein S5]-alanine N-acetyltransferase